MSPADGGSMVAVAAPKKKASKAPKDPFAGRQWVQMNPGDMLTFDAVDPPDDGALRVRSQAILRMAEGTMTMVSELAARCLDPELGIVDRRAALSRLCRISRESLDLSSDLEVRAWLVDWIGRMIDATPSDIAHIRRLHPKATDAQVHAAALKNLTEVVMGSAAIVPELDARIESDIGRKLCKQVAETAFKNKGGRGVKAPIKRTEALNQLFAFLGLGELENPENLRPSRARVDR